MTKEKATEDVICDHEEKILVKIQKYALTENLAESQRAIPFMNYSLKQSLEESNMKTK